MALMKEEFLLDIRPLNYASHISKLTVSERRYKPRTSVFSNYISDLLNFPLSKCPRHQFKQTTLPP